MNDLVVIILTFNEEKHIERAIRSLAAITNTFVIVDAFSTDATCEIAASLDAIVMQHEFVNYAQQFQWALDNLSVKTEWVMRFDADETLTPPLAEEINSSLPRLSTDITGVILKRRHIFMGRWIRHGGRYPLHLLRIWRQGAARIEQRWMDEHTILLRGSTVTFNNDFCDNNLNDLVFFTSKHNRYATHEAIDRLNAEFEFAPIEREVARGASSRQAGLKRLVKNRVYDRLPFGLGPLGYFIWRYIFQLGFLDGREGFIYHGLQGFWYRFLVEARVLELRREISHLSDRTKIKERLSALTGFAVE